MGAGIYYACTTVEADLYDNCDVGVVGGGNSAGQAVMFLAQCCPSRKVHLLIRRTLGPGMSEYLSPAASVQPPMWLSANSRDPQRFMAIVTLRRWTSELAPLSRGGGSPCSAVFVFVGAEPAAEWLPTDIGRDADGYLLTGTDVIRSDRGRAPIAIRARWRQQCRASWPPGMFARVPQAVGFAVGDGSLAVTMRPIACCRSVVECPEFQWQCHRR